MAVCFVCGDDYENERKVLGYSVCLMCGDELAHERKFTVACSNKQGYELITDISFLKQLNPKRTT
jgi:predicted amidophosphoribosyltransferase